MSPCDESHSKMGQSSVIIGDQSSLTTIQKYGSGSIRKIHSQLWHGVFEFVNCYDEEFRTLCIALLVSKILIFILKKFIILLNL